MKKVYLAAAIFLSLFAMDAAMALSTVDDLEVKTWSDNGLEKLVIDWTNPSGAKSFSLFLYTGEISDSDFNEMFADRKPSFWRDVSDFNKKDLMQVPISEPHSFAIKLKDGSGTVSALSNVAKWAGYGDDEDSSSGSGSSGDAVVPYESEELYAPDDLKFSTYSGGKLNLEWTLSPAAETFVVHLYTGEATYDWLKEDKFAEIPDAEMFMEISDENVKAVLDPPNFDYTVYSVFAAVRERDADGNVTDLSNIVVYRPNGGVLPSACYGCKSDIVIENFDGYVSPFPDMNFKNLVGRAAGEMFRRGVVSGYPDGEFKPGNDVNRAEAAKMLLTARYNEVADAANDGKFSDVESDQWYVKYVVTASNLGIISGYPDGTFKPGNNVNTAEFMKMLTLTFDLPLNLPYSYTDVNADDWFAQYAGSAEKYQIFPSKGKTLAPSKNITRGDLVIAIYQYLKNREL